MLLFALQFLAAVLGEDRFHLFVRLLLCTADLVLEGSLVGQGGSELDLETLGCFGLLHQCNLHLMVELKGLIELLAQTLIFTRYPLKVAQSSIQRDLSMKNLNKNIFYYLLLLRR